MRINKGLSSSVKEELLILLRKIFDLFAWTAANMPYIDLAFMCPQLVIFPQAQPVAQKRRQMGSKSPCNTRTSQESFRCRFY